MPQHPQYVKECPSSKCDTRFIGMTPDEYREKHAGERCGAGKLSGLFAWKWEEGLDVE